MDASSPPSDDADRELNELRARAYGPHPDIQVDPAALARLTELEAAHIARSPDGADAEIGAPAAAVDHAPAGDSAWTAPRADRWGSAVGFAPAVTSSGGSPRSLWHRLSAARAGRGPVVAGAVVAILALAYTVAWLIGPHPDATLHASADEADDAVLSMIGFLGAEADPSTIRGYQPYRGVQPWFFVDTQGFHCFMIIERDPVGVDGANCVPPGVDHFADVGVPPVTDGSAEALPDGSIIRFRYRGDSVDVYLYPAQEAD